MTDPDLSADIAFAHRPSDARLTADVNPIEELQREIERLDARIAYLRQRAKDAGVHGNPKYQGLNAQGYRSSAARLQEQQEAAIKQLESHGVKFARLVLPERPLPPKVFKMHVVAHPTGLKVWGGRSEIGCNHEVEAMNYEEAEVRALAEHQEGCQE